jgi:hypothetical protein
MVVSPPVFALTAAFVIVQNVIFSPSYVSVYLAECDRHARSLIQSSVEPCQDGKRALVNLQAGNWLAGGTQTFSTKLQALPTSRSPRTPPSKYNLGSNLLNGW